MSKMDSENKVINENDFAGKMGIDLIGPSAYAELLELCAGTKRVLCAVGPSGVGKTQGAIDEAKRRNNGEGVPYAAIYMPTATPESFSIPALPEDGSYFDQRIPRVFDKILAWATKMEKKYGAGHVPKDMCPILSVEEINRATDKSVTRAAFVVIGDRMIGDTKIPDCVQIVATMNPTGGGMSVNEFEKDPAMRRRLMLVGVGYNYGDFMIYAKKRKMHVDVIDHLQAHPACGYDAQAALAGKSFACPATWEAVSDLCYVLENKGVKFHSPIGRAAITGVIGDGAAAAFLEFARDRVKFITPEDILAGYGPDTETRRRFMSFMESDEGMRTDIIGPMCSDKGVASAVFRDLTRHPSTYVESLSNFLSDLPAEFASNLFLSLHTVAGSGKDGVDAYYRELNKLLAKQPGFTAALKVVHAAKSKGVEEAKKNGV